MPLLSPPPPPAPRSGSRRQLSRSRRRESKRSTKRNWADLPLDALLCVFHKLKQADLMFGGASTACRSWRFAARQPELWRRIDMRGNSRLNRTARLAISFSAGQCEAFLGDLCVNDDLILFLAEKAPSLKSLRVMDSYHLNTESIAEAIRRFPLLEELELSRCNLRDVWWVIQFCPQLKHFRHVKQKIYYSWDNFYAARRDSHNMEAFPIARMPNLLTLQLLGDQMDNAGLSAILDNCPHLELLDLRSCLFIRTDDTSLRLKCARVIREKLCRYDFTHDRVHFCVENLAFSYDDSTDDYCEDFQQWLSYYG